MTEKEIREQIEKECKGCKKTITCFMCIRDKLVKERMISAAKQETIDNFVLGRREE